MRYCKACEFGDWHLIVHPPGDEGSYKRVPYKCRSWRHEGECRLWRGAQDFCRVRDAIATRHDWVYLVLTFAQRSWPDKQKQYISAGTCWSKLRLSLRRRYGRLHYIQTWERHLRGGIHVNVLIGNSCILGEVTCDRWAWRRLVLEPLAVSAGFGKRTYVEPLRGSSGEAMAGYLVKLARELTGAGAKCQIPFDAPAHFRRLRASHGLLPAPIRSGLTGRMVFAPLEAYLPGFIAGEHGRG